MRLLLVLLSCACFSLGTGALKSYDGYRVYSVQLQTDSQLNSIMSLQKKTQEIDFWDHPSKAERSSRVMVAPAFFNNFETFVKEQEINAQIIIEDVGPILIKEQTRNAATIMRSSSSSTKFDHFYRYQEVTDFLKKLAAKYPKLMTLESAGKSFEGRDLWLVKLSNSTSNKAKPRIVMDSTIHAREWIAVMSTLYLIHEMVVNSEKHPEMFAADWFIMPLVNPDGYEYTHTDDRMWRKTRSTSKEHTCVGTDGNRNHGFHWDDEDSDNEPCSVTYMGPKPESEPEVHAIAKVLRETENVKLYLTVHSYGNYLLYPFGYKEDVPNPNTKNLQKLGERVAKAILGKNPSRVFKVGNSAALLYPATGTSDDYAAGPAGVDFAYTIELPGGGEGGFQIGPEKIVGVGEEMFEAYREFAKWAGETF